MIGVKNSGVEMLPHSNHFESDQEPLPLSFLSSVDKLECFSLTCFFRLVQHLRLKLRDRYQENGQLPKSQLDPFWSFYVLVVERLGFLPNGHARWNEMNGTSLCLVLNW
jgi:hypothetical protein